MAKVALLQLDAGPGTVQDTLPRIEDALARAGREGAVLLVAPELATTGYGAGPDFAALAEPEDGPLLTRLRTGVEASGVALVTGFAERDGVNIYNSAVALVPGAPPVVYRKAQLYGDYERDHFRAGAPAAVTTRVGDLTVGLLICFDAEFPEHVRRLALAGCDLVAVPTATPDALTSVFIAEKMLPTRAFENHVFVAYANWAGIDDRFGYAGRSVLSAPDGADLLRAPSRGGFLGVAEVNPSAYEITRRENPYLSELVCD
jgi:predicted amidohydrolase